MILHKYEVILPGYDGRTSDTDHLVLWGFADSKAKVNDAYPGARVELLPDVITITVPDFDLREVAL